MVEPCKARRAPQLPRESVLTSRPLERLSEAFLGVGDVGRGSPHEEQLAVLAQQFGKTPSFFTPLGASQCALHHHKSLRKPPGTAETLRQFRKKEIRVVMKGRLGNSVEPRPQQSRASAALASLDEEHPLEALPPRIPGLHPMLYREIDHQLNELARDRKLTGIQRDRDRRVEERGHHGSRVVLGAGVVDDPVHHWHGLVSESL